MNFPKHYSLHSEDNKQFMIHDARDGKVFPVAKKGIHPANQIKIMKLQKFDDGGDVQDPDPGQVPSSLQANAPDQAPPSSGATGSWDDSQPQAGGSEMPQPQVGGMPTPGKTPDTLGQFQANQGLEEQGLQAKGDAEAKAGELNARAYEGAQSKIAKFMQDSNVPIQKQAQENEALSQALADPKSDIDPKRYYHNLGTGGKIANAIALIFGGAGAGATGGPNMALQVINNAINRDMESQKINLGKKESLLSTNLAKYKDMRSAQLATMTQMNAMAQGQIAANTARYGGLAAQGGAQASLGQMKNQNLQAYAELQKTVFQNQLQQHLSQGDVSKDDPLDYVKWVVPPEQQKDVATELGKAKYAAEYHDYMMSLWDKSQKEQTMMRTGMGLFDAPATRELRLLGDPLIHEADGRVNEFEKKDFEGTMPSSGQLDSRQKELREGFEKFILGKQNAPLAKTYGIDVNKFNSTKMNPKGQDQERAFTQGPYKGKIGIFDDKQNFKGFK